MDLSEALKFYPQFTQEDIARLTGCSLWQIRHAIPQEQLSQSMTKEWSDEIKLTCDHMTAEQIAKKYKTSVLNVYRARHKQPHKDTVQAMVDNTRFIAYIAENSATKTQAEMAAELGVSQSFISKYNPTRRRNGSVIRKTPGQWAEIIAYAKKHNNTRAAVLYGVSRTSIIKRMKNEAE